MVLEKEQDGLRVQLGLNIVAPWFGFKGKGIQYRSEIDVSGLVAKGIMEVEGYDSYADNANTKR